MLDKSLVTEDGEPVRVIYPGRINDDRGADLRDAVIETSRGLVKGDIEVHVKSSNWRAHRHHREPAYNRVILHVVFSHDTGEATGLQNGENVSVLALDKYLTTPEWRQTPARRPCQRTAAPPDRRNIGEFLDNAGEARFLAKATRFQRDLVQAGAPQSLYEGIMEALGYAKNKLPCLELARRLPLSVLESVIHDGRSDEECLIQLQARLLGTAGLLPSQRSNHPSPTKADRWVGELEREWAASRQAGVMSESDWHLFKVRPINLPQRRLAGMGYLLLRYRGKGILEEAVIRLREAPADPGRGLEELLTVTTDGYWADHFAPGLPSPRPVTALIGDTRAADIVVNVLLPFTLALGRLTSESSLAEKAIKLYHRYPGLAVNAVEKHMRQQFGLDGPSNAGPVNSARRQQGLLHIYKTFCSQGECDRCPLG